MKKQNITKSLKPLCKLRHNGLDNDERYVRLSEVGGRIVVLKTSDVITVPSNWETITITAEHLAGNNLSLADTIKWLPSSVPLTVQIPTEYIDAEDSKWMSLLSALHTRREEDAVNVIQVITGANHRARCAEALIKSADTVVVKRNNRYRIQKDVGVITRGLRIAAQTTVDIKF